MTSGANLGDGITDAREMALDDIYALRPNARTHGLTVAPAGEHFTIAATSQLGRAGATLVTDHCATFMCPDGSTVEALVLVETEDGYYTDSYLLPLAPLAPQTEYALVRIDRTAARARLAQMACVSFARGTLITMANGAQKPIEDLRVGDRILTRDNGPRDIRWIGQQTVRATGAFAPIVIKKGVLNNSNDLTLSPNHRLFIYQRRDKIRAGRSEVMVKARLLVNGDSVVQSDGGFVDYYQLLFDQHEIIYAEGIAAESLFVDTQVTAVLPEGVRSSLLNRGLDVTTSAAFEVDDSLVQGPDAVDLLRRASRV